MSSTISRLAAKLDRDLFAGLCCMAILIIGNAVGGVEGETSGVLTTVALAAFGSYGLRLRRLSVAERSRARRRLDEAVDLDSYSGDDLTPDPEESTDGDVATCVNEHRE